MRRWHLLQWHNVCTMWRVVVWDLSPNKPDDESLGHAGKTKHVSSTVQPTLATGCKMDCKPCGLKIASDKYVEEVPVFKTHSSRKYKTNFKRKSWIQGLKHSILYPELFYLIIIDTVSIPKMNGFTKKYQRCKVNLVNCFQDKFILSLISRGVYGPTRYISVLYFK